MADPKIGSKTFLRLRGTLPLNCEEALEPFSRRGVNGVAFQKLAKKAQAVSLFSVVDTSAHTTDAKSYGDLKGTKVTVTLPDGGTFQNVMVLDVRPYDAIALKSCVGGLGSGSARYLLRAQWTLMATETS